MKADKLASFRLDNQLWEDFKAIAATNGTTASALLVSYIELVVNTGNVNTPIPTSLQQSIDNTPTISIQDIDKRIDDKIKAAIQNVNTKSIQDINDTVKKQIKEALADGEIGEAIAKCYRDMMGQFNGLLEELQDLKSQLHEQKAAVPPAVVTNNQSPVTSPQSPVPSREIIDLLGIADIVQGEGEETRYWDAKLIDEGIDQRILDNTAYLESGLGINFPPKASPNKRLNIVLRALGYVTTKGKQKLVDGKQKETYYCSKF